MSTQSGVKTSETPQFRPGLSGALAGLLFLLLCAGGLWLFFATNPRPVSTLVVVAPDQERVFSTISPYGPGLERELVEQFCTENGFRVQWVRTQTMEQAWNMLAEGRAHVFVSTGFAPERINDRLPVVAGPVYETHRPVLLGPATRPGRRSVDEICDRAVLSQDIPSLTRELYRAAVRDNCAPPVPEAQGATVEAPLWRVAADDRSTFALVENGSFLPWRPFHHRVRPAMVLDELVGYRWFWRTDVPRLNERMETFFRKLLRSERLAEMQERYYGFFPEEGAYGRLWLLRNVIRTKLPLYSEWIRDAAERYDLDPLLLVAVIFQESAFDRHAVSYTGVKGLMQLTQQTANALGATDRTDPAQSIYFGAKYLRLLWNELEHLNLTPWNRWAFALAGYNQGIGHVFDAMFLTKRLGKNPKSWRDVKTVLPLLAEEQWHSKTIFGYSRGWEGVEYVDRIRYYYYVLKGLSFLPGLQLEQLAPLVPDLGGVGFRPALDIVRLPVFSG